MNVLWNNNLMLLIVYLKKQVLLLLLRNIPVSFKNLNLWKENVREHKFIDNLKIIYNNVYNKVHSRIYIGIQQTFQTIFFFYFSYLYRYLLVYFTYYLFINNDFIWYKIDYFYFRTNKVSKKLLDQILYNALRIHEILNSNSV